MSEQSRDSEGAGDAWMDRVVARSRPQGRADGAPIDRQQLDRLIADLEDAIVDKLRRGYRVNLGPVILHPDGTVEALGIGH